MGAQRQDAAHHNEVIAGIMDGMQARRPDGHYPDRTRRRRDVGRGQGQDRRRLCDLRVALLLGELSDEEWELVKRVIPNGAALKIFPPNLN